MSASAIRATEESHLYGKRKRRKIRFPVDGIRDGADESNLHAVKCDDRDCISMSSRERCGNALTYLRESLENI